MIDNIRHIRAFLTLARVGNFTRAAAEMHMSQSALTVQIRQLESDLGATLFDRGKRRVSLTQVGQDVFGPLERLVIDSEEVVSRTRDIAGLRRGLVSMAILPSIAAGLIPAAVQRFTKLHPGIVVQIRDVVTAKIAEAVKSEEVDFGIGSRSASERELLSFTLFTDRLGTFVSESHPLAKQPFVTLKQLAETSLILPGRDSSVREIVEAAFKRDGLPFTYAYETNYMSTALGLVECGIGAAVLPEMISGAGCPSKIKCLPIRKPELGRKVEVLQRRDRTLSPAAQKMLEIIREIVKTRYGKREKVEPSE